MPSGPANLLAKLVQQPVALSLVSDRDDIAEWIDLLQANWPGLSAEPDQFAELASYTPQVVEDDRRNMAFTTATPVSFNAMALPAVPMNHPDAAALAVACRLLSHEVLHRQIREQGGAYGSSASWSPSGTVVLASYRDPRLVDTFKDLSAGLSWLKDCDISERGLHEAKLSLIADNDTPMSPSGEAKRRFINDLHGTSPEQLNAFRQRLLQVDAAAIHGVAQRYFTEEAVSRATLTSSDVLSAQEVDWPQVAL